MQDASRHLLSTISYRFEKASEHCNSTYPHLDIGKGVRTPLEILHHMRELVIYAIYRLTEKRFSIDNEAKWDISKELFLHELEKLDRLLEDNIYETDLLGRIIQGPLADMLTHVGQLSMMSRLNDHPVKGMSYYDAPIEVGNIKNN